MSIILTPGQQAAYDAFARFLLIPHEEVFVLAGYAGTGKSTLVKELLKLLKSLPATQKLLDPDSQWGWRLALTATTNKAAEALAQATGEEVSTIQSLLGLRVSTDYRTGLSELVPKRGFETPVDTIIFIDEASYIDSALLDQIFKRTQRCKIVFLGDPAQLLAVKSSSALVFKAGFPGAELTEAVRNTGPILELSTQFRKTVLTGEWFSFKPDGEQVRHLPRETFESELLLSFKDPAWHFSKSKVLAWTNRTVTAYNRAIREEIQGAPELHPGDYAVCNSFVSNGTYALKTDQQVLVGPIGPAYERHGAWGNDVQIGPAVFFMPKSLELKKHALKLAQAADDVLTLHEIQSRWIDLRPAYAQTVNKSQGSTYDEVFIDLDDLGKCRNMDTLARMLYVATSRARTRVTFTGDLA